MPGSRQPRRTSRLQELKAETAAFPEGTIAGAGYHAAWAHDAGWRIDHLLVPPPAA